MLSLLLTACPAERQDSDSNDIENTDTTTTRTTTRENKAPTSMTMSTRKNKPPAQISIKQKTTPPATIPKNTTTTTVTTIPKKNPTPKTTTTTPKKNPPPVPAPATTKRTDTVKTPRVAPDTGSQVSSMPVAAVAFLAKAIQGGIAEVDLGQMALKKSSDPEVREFANQLINDHSEGNRQIDSLAASKQVSLPGQISSGQQATADKLANLTGTAFDKEFIAASLKDHEAAIFEFQYQAFANPDPDVRKLATKTLPTLQHHLQMAREIYTRLK